jgi:hypothetical protein
MLLLLLIHSNRRVFAHDLYDCDCDNEEAFCKLGCRNIDQVTVPGL